MKDVMRLALVVIMMIFGLSVANTYSREATVEKIEDNIVTFIDTTDNEWEWELEEGEKYQENQKVKLIMSNLDTVNITDDIILRIRPE